MILSKEPASKQTGRMDEPFQSCRVANRAKQGLVGKHRSRKNTLGDWLQRDKLFYWGHTVQRVKGLAPSLSAPLGSQRGPAIGACPAFLSSHLWLRKVGHLHKQGGSLDSCQSTEISPPICSSTLGNVCVPIWKSQERESLGTNCGKRTVGFWWEPELHPHWSRPLGFYFSFLLFCVFWFCVYTHLFLRQAFTV